MWDWFHLCDGIDWRVFRVIWWMNALKIFYIQSWTWNLSVDSLFLNFVIILPAKLSQLCLDMTYNSITSERRAFGWIFQNKWSKTNQLWNFSSRVLDIWLSNTCEIRSGTSVSCGCFLVGHYTFSWYSSHMTAFSLICNLGKT